VPTVTLTMLSNLN